MTTGLTYTTYQDQVCQLAVMPTTDANFIVFLPMMITYAENRICRDLDFLQFRQSLTNRSTTINVQTVRIGSDANTPDFVVLEEINAITPAGTTDPNTGTISPLIAVSKEWLRWIYPSSTGAGTPRYFAPLSQVDYLLGPWPNGVFTIQCVGMIRPDSLSAQNTSTFISNYLPDLMIMASMVYISAFQRNFGAMASDPEMAASYENQYKTLLTGAQVEEARKKFAASGWSSMATPAAATPSR